MSRDYATGRQVAWLIHHLNRDLPKFLELLPRASLEALEELLVVFDTPVPDDAAPFIPRTTPEHLKEPFAKGREALVKEIEARKAVPKETVVLVCSCVKREDALGPTGVYGRSVLVPASAEDQKFLFLHLLRHASERDVIGLWCES